jgi:hypothetical protein
MNDLKFAFRQLLKNPGGWGSDQWQVTSDEPAKARAVARCSVAHHSPLITFHCRYE